MALTAFPTILFNASTGSDTLASGAGPATAITGTCAASTNTTTVTFNGNPDLSGIATDGSHVLWVSGIGFVRISTVDDGANTCVVETALTIGAATAFAIGGKRATLDETESRRLWAATSSPTATGAAGGWTIELEDDQSISSTLTAAFTAAAGWMTIQGNSVGSRRTITQTGNATHFTNNTANYMRHKNIIYRNSNATKKEVFTSSAACYIRFENCVIGATDGTDCPLGVGVRTGSGYVLSMYDTGVIRVTGTAVALTNSTCEMYGCEISRSGGAAITSGTGAVVIVNSIISHNSGDGVTFTGVPARLLVNGSTIHGNTGDGLDIGGATNVLTSVIFNNQITANGGWGITFPGTAPHSAICEFNNFGNASDSTNNTSGTINGMTVASSNTTIAPGYTDASAGTRNFAIASSAKATGFPASSSTIAAGVSGTTTYVDIGAAQREEATAGGGSALHLGSLGQTGIGSF